DSEDKAASSSWVGPWSTCRHFSAQNAVGTVSSTYHSESQPHLSPTTSPRNWQIGSSILVQLHRGRDCGAEPAIEEQRQCAGGRAIELPVGIEKHGLGVIHCVRHRPRGDV